jgi:integrase
MLRIKRTYIELGIWEEKAFRKRDDKLIETSYFVEASCRNSPGRKPTRPTKCGRAPNLVEARRLRDELRRQLHEEVFGDPPATLRSFYDNTYRRRIELKLCKASFEDQDCTFRVILQHLGDQVLDSIDGTVLKDFFDNKLSNELRTSTKRKYRKYLKGIFDHARNQRLITHDPIDDLPVLKGKPAKPKLSLSSPQLGLLLAFLESIGHQFFLHVSVASMTAARVNEQRGLQWGDILWDENKIHIQRTYSFKTQEFGPPKNGYDRKVPMCPELREILWKRKLEVLPSESDFVLPWNRKWVSGEQGKELTNALKFLGLPLITYYQLKHSFAGALLRNTGDLMLVKEVLGHQSVSSTNYYLINHGHTIQGAADSIHFLSEGRRAIAEWKPPTLPSEAVHKTKDKKDLIKTTGRY